MQDQRHIARLRGGVGDGEGDRELGVVVDPRGHADGNGQVAEGQGRGRELVLCSGRRDVWVMARVRTESTNVNELYSVRLGGRRASSSYAVHAITSRNDV